MHFPTNWDPYFQSTMAVRETYHYGTEHREHDRRQISPRCGDDPLLSRPGSAGQRGARTTNS